MAKKGTEALKRLRSENNDGGGRQGIGYYVPPTMAKEDWKQLRRHWDNKLKASKFSDIEQFSHDCTGHFSPFFTKTQESGSVSGSSTSAARNYDSATLEYYRRLGLFLHHADLLSIFKHQAYLYKLMLALMSEGATYQALVNWLEKEAPRPLKARKSIYWAYYHVQLINEAVSKWAKENVEWLDNE